VLAEQDGEEIVNHNIRLLGRHGYISAVLVADVPILDASMAELDQIVGGVNYKQGQSYAEYVQGDKVAKYGLTALIAGGSAAAAAKFGLFKFLGKAWKALLVGVLAVFAFMRKILKSAFDCLFILQRENRGAQVQQLLSLVFSPVNAAHAGFLLTKDLYGRFAFPALCAAFLPREAFLALARKEFARIDSCLPGERAADWMEHWQTRKETLTRLLTEVGTSEDEIRKAPNKKDPAARWYCPACLGEYIEGTDLCGDCELQLEKF